MNLTKRVVSRACCGSCDLSAQYFLLVCYIFLFDTCTGFSLADTLCAVIVMYSTRFQAISTNFARVCSARLHFSCRFCCLQRRVSVSCLLKSLDRFEGKDVRFQEAPLLHLTRFDQCLNVDISLAVKKWSCVPKTSWDLQSKRYGVQNKNPGKAGDMATAVELWELWTKRTLALQCTSKAFCMELQTRQCASI